MVLVLVLVLVLIQVLAIVLVLVPLLVLAMVLVLVLALRRVLVVDQCFCISRVGFQYGCNATDMFKNSKLHNLNYTHTHNHYSN